MYRRMPKYLASRAFSSEPPDHIPPLRRHRTATSVLEALSRATGVALTDPSSSRDKFFLSDYPATTIRFHEHVTKGREAARYFRKVDPNLFSKFRFAQPQTGAFQPTHAPENVGDDSEPALKRLIASVQSSAARKMFWRLTEDGARLEAVSMGVRLRLLELLAADVGPLTLRTDAREFCKPLNCALHHSQTWDLDGPAERLFATFEGEERSQEAYQAMIRGAADLRNPMRALQLYAEMRDRGLQPDLLTFNALIEAASSAQEGPWQAVLRLYGDLLAAGRKPNVESFNAMLRALPGEEEQRLLSVIEEMRLREVKPNLGTAAALLYLVPITPSVLMKRQVLFVLNRLLASPGRLEFSQLADTKLPFFLFDAIEFLDIQLLKRLVRLYTHSPNLWPNRIVTGLFLYRLFKKLSWKSPHSALRFYKEHIAYRNLLPPMMKLKTLRLFIALDPDSVDVVMNDVFNALVFSRIIYSKDTLDDMRSYVAVMHQVAQLQSFCHKALFRSAQHFCRILPEDVFLPDEARCLLIAVCLPKLEIANIKERVSLAWEIFKQISPKARFSQAYNLLLLCLSLMELNRLEDAAFLLGRFLAAAEVQETELRVSKALLLFKKILLSEAFVDFLQEQEPDVLTLARQWKGDNITETPADPIHEVRLGGYVIRLSKVKEDGVPDRKDESSTTSPSGDNFRRPPGHKLDQSFSESRVGLGQQKTRRRPRATRSAVELHFQDKDFCSSSSRGSRSDCGRDVDSGGK